MLLVVELIDVLNILVILLKTTIFSSGFIEFIINTIIGRISSTSGTSRSINNLVVVVRGSSRSATLLVLIIVLIIIYTALYTNVDLIKLHASFQFRKRNQNDLIVLIFISVPQHHLVAKV